MKKVLLLLSSVILGYIIISGNWYIKCPTDIQKKQDLPLEIKAIVTKKYIDYKNHAAREVQLDNNGKIISWVFGGINSGGWHKIEGGDSVYKSKGSMDLVIKRKDKDTIHIKFICDSDNVPNWE